MFGFLNDAPWWFVGVLFIIVCVVGYFTVWDRANGKFKNPNDPSEYKLYQMGYLDACKDSSGGKLRAKAAVTDDGETVWIWVGNKQSGKVEKTNESLGGNHTDIYTVSVFGISDDSLVQQQTQ